ncbi:AAA family ATPase [Nonomuraea typhae]|uniref:AAA family ATPase n=1 Tax=Nonomuraea typhae TaxID=2603600 RepID=UPI0012F734E1|nr:AAA family ATPase [Nonomuraea typhae]
MKNPPEAAILPYAHVVGQDPVKRALELNYVAPGIGGVLVTGQRGTAKSTLVRAFALMMYGELPVTLPINATDDRVLGGWRLDQLMRGEPVQQPGLLEEADRHGMLYIDEVNLLDDHVVNLILDAASTGVLTVQREAIDEHKPVRFNLVGTMNPEEGGLRPQLLDRFGLAVEVTGDHDPRRRREVLLAVLAMDEARHGAGSAFLEEGRKADQRRRAELLAARERLYDVPVPPATAQLCVDVALEFQAAGHRGDVVMALAARALAALEGSPEITAEHVLQAAPPALRHRRSPGISGSGVQWSAADEEQLRQFVRSRARPGSEPG